MPSELVIEQIKKKKLAEFPLPEQIENLRKAFRVRSHVVARRLYDLHQIDESTYHRLRTSEQKRFEKIHGIPPVARRGLIHSGCDSIKPNKQVNQVEKA